MNTDNFIAFFTVCGFFTGLIFSLLRIEEPMHILTYTLVTTFFFYIVIHITIMNFIKAGNLHNEYFNKEKYEEVNDYLIDELSIRERRMEPMISLKKDLLKKAGKDDRNEAKAA